MKVALVIPVYNERLQIEKSMRTLWNAAKSWRDFETEIIIANNGSTDGTGEIADRLAETMRGVRHVKLLEKGRGRALRNSWLAADADIVSYMDVDLSTNLVHFPELIEPLIAGKADLAIGSRLLRPEWTSRGIKREFLSRSYNYLIHLAFRPSFSDAQCGFKAITKRAAETLIPHVENEAWFFDTELLILAVSMGFRVADVPVRWQDDPDSRVRIIPTVIEDLKGILRLRRKLRSLNMQVSCQHSSGRLHADRRERGFTLIELLATIAIIAVLASLTLPSIMRGKTRVKGAVCLNNLSQLQKCWQMYVDDNQDRVPPNVSILTNNAWRSSVDSWIGNSNAMLDTTYDPIKNGLLFRYDYNKSLNLYRCPADTSKVKGSRTLRTRSYSMNGNMGGRTNEIQFTVATTRAIPDPSHLFVFIDEAEDSIDDAHFLVWLFPDERWVNLPAGRHGNIGTLSFVDGHVESWRWRAPKVFAPKESYWKRAKGEDLKDLHRLQQMILSPIMPPPG